MSKLSAFFDKKKKKAFKTSQISTTPASAELEKSEKRQKGEQADEDASEWTFEQVNNTITTPVPTNAKIKIGIVETDINKLKKNEKKPTTWKSKAEEEEKEREKEREKEKEKGEKNEEKKSPLADLNETFGAFPPSISSASSSSSSTNLENIWRPSRQRTGAGYQKISFDNDPDLATSVSAMQKPQNKSRSTEGTAAASQKKKEKEKEKERDSVKDVKEGDNDSIIVTPRERKEKEEGKEQPAEFDIKQFVSFDDICKDISSSLPPPLVKLFIDDEAINAKYKNRTKKPNVELPENFFDLE